MTTAAERIKAQAAAREAKKKAQAAGAEGRPAAEPPAEPEVPAAREVPAAEEPAPTPKKKAAPKVVSPLAKPVRSTVDLPPARHASLKAWCGETAVQLGVSRVTTQDVMGAMVTLLLTDETMARRLRAQIRQDKEA